jgi:hypothetical protein
MARDDLTATEARDFVMARLGAAHAAVASAASVITDVLGAIADGDHEYETADALDEIDESLGEATRAVHAASSLLEQVDPEEAEPDLPEGDGHDGDEGDGEQPE